VPEELTFREGVRVIKGIAKSIVAQSGKAIIGVGGPVGAGKTLFSKYLTKSVVSIDNYYHDFESLQTDNYDLPETADLKLLEDHLLKLKSNQDIKMPIWSYKTHCREKIVNFRADTIIACEGIHALHKNLIRFMDVRIVIWASTNTRWHRWRRIEERGERGWGSQKAKDYFFGIAEPTFNFYKENYLKGANYVVINEINLENTREYDV
jgi:uridine kinase